MCTSRPLYFCKRIGRTGCLHLQGRKYSCLLMSTGLTSTARVMVPYHRTNVAEKKNTSCQKEEFLSVSSVPRSLGVQFISNLKSNICTALTRQNTRD